MAAIYHNKTAVHHQQGVFLPQSCWIDTYYPLSSPLCLIKPNIKLDQIAYNFLSQMLELCFGLSLKVTYFFNFHQVE